MRRFETHKQTTDEGNVGIECLRAVVVSPTGVGNGGDGVGSASTLPVHIPYPIKTS